jgi:hypothetical protein
MAWNDERLYRPEAKVMVQFWIAPYGKFSRIRLE